MPLRWRLSIRYLPSMPIPCELTSDAAICGFVVLVAAIVLAFLLRFVFSGAKRASFAAVVIVVWCFAFGASCELAGDIIESISYRRTTTIFCMRASG